MERSAIPRSPWPISRRSNAAMLSRHARPCENSRIRVCYSSRRGSLPFRDRCCADDTRAPRVCSRNLLFRDSAVFLAARLLRRVDRHSSFLFSPTIFQFFARDVSFFLLETSGRFRTRLPFVPLIFLAKGRFEHLEALAG